MYLTEIWVREFPDCSPSPCMIWFNPRVDTALASKTLTTDSKINLAMSAYILKTHKVLEKQTQGNYLRLNQYPS